MLKVDIKSNKAEFMLELRDKITVIQGVSGSHKTQMIKTIESRDNAHEVTLSNNSFRLVVLSPQIGISCYLQILVMIRSSSIL